LDFNCLFFLNKTKSFVQNYFSFFFIHQNEKVKEKDQVNEEKGDI